MRYFALEPGTKPNWTKTKPNFHSAVYTNTMTLITPIKQYSNVFILAACLFALFGISTLRIRIVASLFSTYSLFLILTRVWRVYGCVCRHLSIALLVSTLFYLFSEHVRMNVYVKHKLKAFVCAVISSLFDGAQSVHIYWLSFSSVSLLLAHSYTHRMSESICVNVWNSVDCVVFVDTYELCERKEMKKKKKCVRFAWYVWMLRERDREGERERERALG